MNIVTKVLKILIQVEGLSRDEFNSIKEDLLAFEGSAIISKTRCKHLEELNRLLLNGSKKIEYESNDHKTVTTDNGSLMTYHNGNFDE